MPSICSIFNNFGNLFRSKQIVGVIEGLDASGKTTFLYRWKTGKDSFYTIPTIGFNVEEVKVDNIKLLAYDVGGRMLSQLHTMEKCYFQDSKSVVSIFLIDSNDRERIVSEVKEYFKTSIERKLDNYPMDAILILANKQDLDGAMTVDEICQHLELETYLSREKPPPPIGIFPIVAKTGEGFEEAFSWLHSVVSGLHQLTTTICKPDTMKVDKQNASYFTKFVDIFKQYIMY